jgi:hypothetical protein
MPSPVAIHTRVGREVALKEPWLDEEEEGEEEEGQTYFSPRVAEHTYTILPECLDSRQWSIVAQAHGNIVQLFCLPLGWRDPMEEDDDDVEDEFATDDLPFYLTTKLVLPQTGFVREVGFYSDDGKSSLSSGNDSGTGKERRQKLGMLYQDGEQLELWLASYDSLMWQAVPFESILMGPSEVEDHCTKEVQAMPEMSEEDEEVLEDDDSILLAQSK